MSFVDATRPYQEFHARNFVRLHRRRDTCPHHNSSHDVLVQWKYSRQINVSQSPVETSFAYQCLSSILCKTEWKLPPEQTKPGGCHLITKPITSRANFLFNSVFHSFKDIFMGRTIIVCPHFGTKSSLGLRLELRCPFLIPYSIFFRHSHDKERGESSVT